MTDCRALAKEQEDYIIETRHHLHMYPELGTEEKETTRFIVGELEKMGIPVQTFDDITGCVATIEGSAPGATLMLRADIDALPVTEVEGRSYGSTCPGVMHACGHDCHTAILLAAARILKEHSSEFRGTVKLIFQMGEEIGRMSGEYVKRGVLEGVDAIFGMHVWSEMDSGTVNFQSGERMACSDRFVIKILGESAHGSAPHRGRDAILAASAVVMALQTLRSRICDPLDTLVVSVGMMNGGTKENIIAREAELVGTVRSFNRPFRESMPERIRAIAEQVAGGYGCSAETDYCFGPSPLINDHDDLTNLAREAAAKIMGKDALIPLEKMMGAEDFSVYMENVPGVFGYLGVRNRDKGIDSPHHNPAFDVDEAALYNGTAIYVQFALDYLASAAGRD